MWAVGAVVHELLGGEQTFQTYETQINGKYELSGPPRWCHISKNAKEMIRNLLNTNPKYRWSAEDALRCAWLMQDDVDSSGSTSAAPAAVEHVLGNYHKKHWEYSNPWNNH
jgi:calcium/calmodulin-dependent protein kinase I